MYCRQSMYCFYLGANLQEFILITLWRVFNNNNCWISDCTTCAFRIFAEVRGGMMWFINRWLPYDWFWHYIWLSCLKYLVIGDIYISFCKIIAKYECVCAKWLNYWHGNRALGMKILFLYFNYICLLVVVVVAYWLYMRMSWVGICKFKRKYLCRLRFFLYITGPNLSHIYFARQIIWRTCKRICTSTLIDYVKKDSQKTVFFYCNKPFKYIIIVQIYFMHGVSLSSLCMVLLSNWQV